MTEIKTPVMAPERMAYFEGLPAFVRNVIALADEGELSGDLGDARGWLEHRKLTIKCSADILSDRNWAELNHLDAFLNDLRKAEEGAS